MIWPTKTPPGKIVYAGARLVKVESDEAGGVLNVDALFDDSQHKNLTYDGMFYSQLDTQSEGLTVSFAIEVTPQELQEKKYAKIAARFYEECGADDEFVIEMYGRGNRLFVHHTQYGEYLVLAKRLFIEAI